MSPHLRRLLLFLLLVLLAAGPCRSPLAGELRCRCVRAVSDVIPPRRLARVELVAEGPHCAVPEVIATTKQGQTVCLSPSAPWVKLLYYVKCILHSDIEKHSSKCRTTLLPLKPCFWGVVQEIKYREYPESFHRKKICLGSNISVKYISMLHAFVRS
uniref:Chemokine interleukin-8-like domain-containing protein n=1 Tax=Strix occidentalis caurina TaxID=311401 RepID=A0A8D0KXD6_STROC